ncbi:MAG: tyrosine-type recombinase/integrase [Propionibacteriales bacterium]|nr:tyrosine-type recombinase/integrase [Propionibacteriales bacterium]
MRFPRCSVQSQHALTGWSIVRAYHIRLHDVRHTFSTMAMDAGANPKTLSDRIGHADSSFTLPTYTHGSRGQDREMAQDLAAIVAWSEPRRTKPGPSADPGSRVVAGAGFEPATSGRIWRSSLATD